MDWHGFTSFVHKPSESPGKTDGEGWFGNRSRWKPPLPRLPPPPRKAVLTGVMLDQLLQRVKGYLGRDVEAAIVHVADSVVLDLVADVAVEVPDGQREGA